MDLRPAAVCLAAVAVVAGGCSAPAGGGAPSESPAPTGHGPLPLDRYRPDADERHRLAAAETELTNSCLSRFGVTERLTVPDKARMVAEQDLSDSRLYGLTDEQQAEEWGYHTPGTPPESADPEFEGDARFVLVGSRSTVEDDPEQRESPGSVDGRAVPPGGCLGRARQKLYGEPGAEAHFTLASDLAATAWERSKRSAPVRERITEWADCMSSAGHAVTDPLEVQVTGDEPTGDEKAMAVDDVECKSEVDLARTWRTENIAAERRLVRKNKGDLARDARLLKKALAVAGRRVG